jgi:NADP-dependent aldehyde dehydrogenase
VVESPHATDEATVGDVCRRAGAASIELARRSRAERADLLCAAADQLADREDAIVSTAEHETGHPRDRLAGELARTCHQLRMFAGVVTEGSYIEAVVDHARPDGTPPTPDIRRMLVPLGPVAVFGASNFPLAFSTPGGDTASALAAGCAVVVKVHESHPATSRRCWEALHAAATGCGLSGDIVQEVHGRDAGLRLVGHPLVTAVGFTGSLSAGRALLEAVNARPDPIPFYGEMSSVNPVVVLPGAASRGAELGRELGAALTTLAGQICTKPGLVLVPAGPEGDAVLDGIDEVVASFTPRRALNDGIAASARAHVERLSGSTGVTPRSAGAEGEPNELQARVWEVALDAVATDVVTEVFAPAQLVARYGSLVDLTSAVARLEPSLTATLHGADEELVSESTAALRDLLIARSGRLICNGVPTGVAVTWGQHHGGPFPATNSLHSSVGATAIRRFLRPFAWQNAPAGMLPEELRDGAVDLPRRVDGRFVG